jgi:hypothetical protein
MTRIAFFGRMGSGKTTAAQYLVDEHGFQRVSFASPLKKIGELRETLFEDQWYDWLTQWTFKLLPEPIYGRRFASFNNGVSVREQLVVDWIKDFKESKDKRELLQRIGTDSGRKANPMIWVNYFARHLPDGNLVVDDLRFENEKKALEDLSFQIVKMVTPDEDRMIRLVERDGFFDPATQIHASEVELADAEGDATINNDRLLDIENLYGVLDEMARVPATHLPQVRL